MKCCVFQTALSFYTYKNFMLVFGADLTKGGSIDENGRGVIQALL